MPLLIILLLLFVHMALHAPASDTRPMMRGQRQFKNKNDARSINKPRPAVKPGAAINALAGRGLPRSRSDGFPHVRCKIVGQLVPVQSVHILTLLKITSVARLSL